MQQQARNRIDPAARTRRGLLARRQVFDNLVSVAGLWRAPVVDLDGRVVGRLMDVVVRRESSVYPVVSGLIVRVGLRRAFVHASQIGHVAPRKVQLTSTRLDLQDFVRRPGEVLLITDVLDHQLVDVDGARVVRAADLYLVRVGEVHLAVGVDVSFGSFLRRVLPGAAGSRATPERVLDFAAVQPFGRPGEPLQLARPHKGLRHMRPAELADLLEDLGRPERAEFLAMLEPETAADTLEEMEPEEVENLLRDIPEERAAELLTKMEPDEAVDALRDLPSEDRDALLAEMHPRHAEALSTLLAYPEGVAGGIMTTKLVTLTLDDTIATARELVTKHKESEDVDGLVVVDSEGHLIDDLSLLDLIVADPDERIAYLVRPPYPATVTPDAPLDEIIERLTTNRGASLVVVDEENRPLGRILPDDVIDALVESRTERRWPWQHRGATQ